MKINVIFLFILINIEQTVKALPNCKESVKRFPGYSCYSQAKIGEGSFGQVFLVEDQKSELFALKVMEISKSADNPLKEYESANMFNHGNIIKMYDYYSDGTYFYVIQEFGVKGDLAKFVETEEFSNFTTLF